MYSKNTKIRDWYEETFNELKPNTHTFEDLMDTLKEHRNVYVVLGTKNTYIRDCAFQVLADIYEDGNYQKIYNLWVS